MTLTGQVVAGVEHGCLILKDQTTNKTYLLLSGDPNVVSVGAWVRVVGSPAPGVMSYCMQGEPFRVTEAHPL
jgi:hypothetical protein